MPACVSYETLVPPAPPPDIGPFDRNGGAPKSVSCCAWNSSTRLCAMNSSTPLSLIEPPFMPPTKVGPDDVMADESAVMVRALPVTPGNPHAAVSSSDPGVVLYWNLNTCGSSLIDSTAIRFASVTASREPIWTCSPVGAVFTNSIVVPFRLIVSPGEGCAPKANEPIAGAPGPGVIGQRGDDSISWARFAQYRKDETGYDDGTLNSGKSAMNW